MKKYFTLILFAIPAIASAQFTGIQGLISRIGTIVEKLIILVAAIALLGFLWGLAKFIFKSGDEGAQEEGKNIMKWGLIALFVMMSVWGIIRWVQDDLGIQRGGVIQIQTVGPNRR